MKIKISAHARKKAKEIYRYSLRQWGKHAAVEYVAKLKLAYQGVAEGTKFARIKPELSFRYPCYLAQKHYIFFEFEKDLVTVVDIIHSAMDAANELSEV